jgi:hypothetical protein
LSSTMSFHSDAAKYIGDYGAYDDEFPLSMDTFHCFLTSFRLISKKDVLILLSIT